MKKFFSYLQKTTWVVIVTCLIHLIFRIIKKGEFDIHYFRNIGDVIVPTIISFSLIICLWEIEFLKKPREWKSGRDIALIINFCISTLILGVLYYDYAFGFSSDISMWKIEYAVAGLSIVAGVIRLRYSIVVNIVASMLPVILYADAGMFTVSIICLTIASLISVVLRYLIFSDWGTLGEKIDQWFAKKKKLYREKNTDTTGNSKEVQTTN